MLLPTPPDPNYKTRVLDSFAKQQLLQELNARIIHMDAGCVHIEAPCDPRFTQQDGFLHAGIITALIDSACGYAAYTLMPVGSRVLSVEFKVNLLNPAGGETFRAEGRVLKSGKTLTVCNGKLLALQDGQETLTAVIQATMICIPKH